MVNIETLKTMWRRSQPLTLLFCAMLVLVPLNIAGLFLDSRLITNAPAWLKPLKFALSVAIFSGTVVWLLPYLPSYVRQARWASRIVALCLAIEMVIIDGQAARGVSSHFNQIGLDGALFGIMGAAILTLWFATVWLCILLFLQKFTDRPFGWALRLGMTITVVGAITGGMMTRATGAQRMAATHSRPSIIGAHTVGGVDGEPGLPGVTWSKTHGDLRIPHFFGLHGLQAVPLLYCFVIRPRSRQQNRTGLVVVAGASYASFALLLGWQALRGQSIVMPDTTTVVALSLWAALTVTGAILATAGQSRQLSTVGTVL